jgi:tetratricopeptide (TPR) repeat protein
LKRENAQAWTLNELATAYSISGQPRRAQLSLELHNATYEKVGSKNNLARGILNTVTAVQMPIGALRKAEHNLFRGIDLCRESKQIFVEGASHAELGRILVYAGLFEDAEKEFSKSIELFEELNAIQYIGVVWSYRTLRFLLMARDAVGNSQSPIEDLKSSIESARGALELTDKQAKDIPVPRDYVRAYWLLGAAYYANNELTLAEENLSRALDFCRQINSVDAEADILLDIARLRYAQGDFKDAQEKASEALAITERCGYVLQGADVHLFLATLAEKGYKLEEDKDLSDKDAALLHAREALKLATCDGPPYYYKVAYDEAERLIARLQA